MSVTKSSRMSNALQLFSWIGLAASLVTLAISTPKLVEEGGGWGVILGNITQYGRTIVLLLVVFVKTRTIGARALLGAALGGFFGVSSLAV